MPTAKRTTAAKRAVRKRPAKRKPNRKGGRRFFFSMLLILVFALVYYFFGVDIQSRLGIRFGGTAAIALEDNEILVSFLDVGQGDSIVVRSNNHAILIDGGEHAQRNVVLRYLRDAGVRRLDYVVATHPHSDHIGGLVTVLRQLDVGRVIMPYVTHSTNTFLRFLDVIENNNIPVMFPQPGDTIQAGIINFTILGPPSPHPGPSGNLNNASVILRLEHGQNSFLFTGDAERELEYWLVNNVANLSATVLNVGHHGSRTSSTEAFLDAVNPRAAVISLGADNIYGHPHREVMDRLNARGIIIYRTDQLGTIRMITDGQRIDLLR
ncbi:MAG: MBL fold metallo-hydrolase [Firmicutes bacterium]|nr:MBL fold metallo-hydrolase [Bacillota bacterium]